MNDIRKNERRDLVLGAQIAILLVLGACRLPEGAIDRTLGDLRAGSRSPILDPSVRGLCVAIAPDASSVLNPESDQLQSMAVREADLKDVLAVFFKKSDLNLDLDNDVAGPTTFDYKKTTISDAFLSILDANGLGFRHDGDFIRVSKTETRLYQINYMTGNIGSAGGQAGAVTSDSSAGNTSIGFNAILNDVKNLAGEGSKVVANETAGTIAVTAGTSNLKKIESYLAKVQEVIGRQVLIETQVFEVTLSDASGAGANALLLKNFFSANNNTGLVGDNTLGFDVDEDGFLGVDGGATSGSTGIKFGILHPGKYALAMNAFQTMGQVRILSAPRVLSLNNQLANIQLVEQVPSITQDSTISNGIEVTKQQVTFVDAGISIKVIPQITDSGEIWAQISPSITSVTKTITTPDGKSSVPQLNTRETSATLHVRDGQTILLGGIRSIRKNESNEGVPILMDIPLIGWLFRSNQQEKGETELVIMMTPTIVRPDQMPFLIEEGLSRVERIRYPYHLGFHNLNNAEDMKIQLPPTDQANLTYRRSPSDATPPEQTITRAGLARLFLNRGIRYYEEKNYFAAKAQLDQSRKFHKLGGESDLYLGLIAMAESDRDGAKRHLEGRLAADSQDGVALNNRGIMEILEGNPVIAEPYLRKACAVIPNNPHAWNNLGMVYAMLGHKEKAREAYGSALGLESTHAEANYNLARLYDAEGFTQAAIPHYEAFLDALPNQSKPQTLQAAHRLLALRK